MNKIIYKILISWVLFSMNESRAQIPINDPSWILQPSGTSGGTEEFNGSIDYTNKWFNQYPWGPVNNSAEYNYPSNLIHGPSDTILTIRGDTLVPGVLHAPYFYNNIWANGVTFVYQSGAIQSKK